MSPAPQTSRGRTTTVSKPSPFALAHRLLGLRLGRRVERLRVGPQRRRLVDVHERLAGQQRRLGADVDEAPHARPRAQAVERVARARRRCRARTPPAGPTRRGGRRAWKATSQPAAPARMRRAVAEVAAHRLGAERRRPWPPSASERASARTGQPSATRRSISRPPMKPEPPVTKLGSAIAAMLFSGPRRAAVALGLDRPQRHRVAPVSARPRLPRRGPPRRRPAGRRPGLGEGLAAPAEAASACRVAGDLAAAHSATSSASSARPTPSQRPGAQRRRARPPSRRRRPSPRGRARSASSIDSSAAAYSPAASCAPGEVGEGQAAREDVAEPFGQLAVAPGQRQRRLEFAAVGQQQRLVAADPARGLRVALLGGDPQRRVEQLLGLLESAALAQRHRLAPSAPRRSGCR